MKNLFFLFILFIWGTATLLFSQPVGKKLAINDNVSRSFININNIYTSVYNNGKTDTDNNFYFPTSSGVYMGFVAGFVFGIKIPNENYPRVGGSLYSSGLQPGFIKQDGTASDPASDKFRVYRVRADVYPGGPWVALSNEKAGEADTASIRLQYEKDWNQWPADLGAPFTDIDRDGIYNPAVDIPGVPGADQTLWYVANDLNSTLTRNFAGADPLGIEIQCTIWAYHVNGTLGNTIFRKFRFINKSNTSENPSGIVFDSMYVSLFSDADISDYENDIAGSDSSLGLCYMYNSSEPPESTDKGFPEPSLSIELLSGPIVDSPGDTAELNGRYIINKKNLLATATLYFDRYSTDENLKYPEGSQQYYNLMRGRYARTGTEYFDIVNQKATSFIYDGDPIKETGWFQKPNTFHDSVFGIASGPFTMAPGDTQEVVFAEYAVIAEDRISSVKSLRFSASVIRDFFNKKINIKNTPPPPYVSYSSNEKGIELDWNIRQSAIDSTENFNNNGYSFEGYNVYQLEYPNVNLKDYSLRLATFDKPDNVKNIQGIIMDPGTGYPIKGDIQFGRDSGIKRKIVISYDSLFTLNHLIIGKTYYYAVTAYTYNPDLTLINHSTESLITIIPVVFRGDYPGKKFADTLTVNHISGRGDETESVIPIVTDPVLLSGDQYRVTFDTLNSGELVWNLYDVTKKQEVLKRHKLNDTVSVISGVKLIVKGSRGAPSFGNGSNSYDNGDRYLGGYAPFSANDKADIESKYQDLEFRFTGVPVSGATDPDDTLIVSRGSIATIYNSARTIARKIRIPFELWEVERNRQINVIVRSYSRLWAYEGIPLWYSINAGDYITSVATSYNPFAGANEINYENPHIVWDINLYGNWKTGDILRLHFDNPLTSSDEYIFNTDPLNQLKIQSSIPDKYVLYQNYPNPFNPITTIKYSIPQTGYVKVIIYNILGQEVGSFVNLRQAKGGHQLPVNLSNFASGVYIYTLNVNGEFKIAKKMVLIK